MKTFFKERWVETFITLFSFFLCFSFFSVVTDDYQSFLSNLAEGQFSNYSYCVHYWGYVGLSSILHLFYNLSSAYDWMDMALIVFEFFGLYFILRSIKNVLLENSRLIVPVRIIQIFFAAFFLENIIYLSHTRCSLIFCGVALINLIFSNKIDKKSILLNMLIFISGMLIRPESGMGTLLIVSVGYLIYRFDLKHLFRRSFPAFLAVGIMSLTYYIDWRTTDLFFKKAEPEIEYKLGGKRVVDISAMRTRVDSVKYEAAAAGFCFDTRVLTPEYFRSILLPGPNLTLEHASLRFFHTLSFYRYYLFIPCCYILFLLLCLFQPDRWIWLFKILLFELATFVIIFCVDYTGGLIYGRHFLNLQLISLLIISFYFFGSPLFTGFWYQKASLQRGLLLSAITVSCFFIVLTGTCLSILNYKKSSDIVAQSTLCAESVMQAVDNIYSNRVIVFTTDYFHLFDHPFSIRNKKYTRNTYLMFDVWTYYLFPDYIDYLKSECNCDPLDPTAFFSWLSANNALYIAEPWRYDLTSKYMNVVHGQRLEFVTTGAYKKPDCVAHTNMEEFELRKVIVQQ